MPSELAGLVPRWAASARVGAFCSTRGGGVSAAPYDSLNLGAGVGDAAAAVAENRRRFAAHIGAAPVWLAQVHGASVLRLTPACVEAPPVQADAAWSDVPGLACTVLVADCLPVLLAAPHAVAAAHAGWRGLAAGVLEATLDALCTGAGVSADQLHAWLGPCIGPRQFEVGADVLAAFGCSAQQPGPSFVQRARADGELRWLADLPRLAEARLRAAGVRHIDAAAACTVEDRLRFFSYRRDGISGRMAAAVWLRS